MASRTALSPCNLTKTSSSNSVVRLAPSLAPRSHTHTHTPRPSPPWASSTQPPHPSRPLGRVRLLIPHPASHALPASNRRDGTCAHPHTSIYRMVRTARGREGILPPPCNFDWIIMSFRCGGRHAGRSVHPEPLRAGPGHGALPHDAQREPRPADDDAVRGRHGLARQGAVQAAAGAAPVLRGGRGRRQDSRVQGQAACFRQGARALVDDVLGQRRQGAKPQGGAPRAVRARAHPGRARAARRLLPQPAGLGLVQRHRHRAGLRRLPLERHHRRRVGAHVHHRRR